MNPIHGAALACVAVLAALEPVSLRLTPRQGFAPLSIRAEVVIPRHEANRGACVTLEGPMSYESCWEMAGTHSAAVVTKFWYDLPAGIYQARARILRGETITYSATVTFTVHGDEAI